MLGRLDGVSAAVLEERLVGMHGALERIEGALLRQNGRLGAVEAFANRAKGVGIVAAALGGVGGIIALATRLIG